ncbi:hypothetical protein [Roseomonas marmotae]|uniref:Uncharacterized protein n=1 Tax=Roseomonas marmotae TaxID=2768161 RepID=A0ABS3KBA2_9PROT|nr:hypothetical protein [Roseomonas marmotae]MBO1074267.1 hypothetical protein [Roseomonas marmotae]QTI78021.1 hypothetical protein IAI58_09805 [Roseomonas marmotae]
MFRRMFIAPVLRPADRLQMLSRSRQTPAAVIALFESEEIADAALHDLGTEVLQRASAGVRMLTPAPGLREMLYAAGALLVVAD